MPNRIRQLLIKEFIQTFRDPSARFALIVPLIIQMLIFGYAATFELRRVQMVVLNLDHSYESRDLISRFVSSHHFEIEAYLSNPRQLARAIDRGQATVAIQILPGFAEALRAGSSRAQIQVILDGSDSNTALIALGYINQIASGFAQDYMKQRMLQVMPVLAEQTPSVQFQPRPWYNSNLSSQWFFVPGTMANLLAVSVLTLAAFGIVREREMGTLEQVMVSPISRTEFILGKTGAPFIIAMGQLAVIMGMARLWFEVPFRGSYLVLLAGTSLFVLSLLGVAIFLSTISVTQQQSLMGSFFFIMPATILSGFAFPISSMPVLVQYVTYLDPLRYYLVIIRDSFLKGVGFGVLWPQIAALTATSVVLLGLSTLRFHKSLE